MLLFLCLQVICKALPGVKAEKNQIVNNIREHFQMLYSALQTRYTSIINLKYWGCENKGYDHKALDCWPNSPLSTIGSDREHYGELA